MRIGRGRTHVFRIPVSNAREYAEEMEILRALRVWLAGTSQRRH